MIRELQSIIAEVQQAHLRGDIDFSIECEILTLKEHLCKSLTFCHECMQAHQRPKKETNSGITNAELQALLGASCPRGITV